MTDYLINSSNFSEPVCTCFYIFELIMKAFKNATVIIKVPTLNKACYHKNDGSPSVGDNYINLCKA